MAASIHIQRQAVSRKIEIFENMLSTQVRVQCTYGCRKLYLLCHTVANI